MPLASEHMPLIERLRKGANYVVFLDGAPEPAAVVADMLRKAADEIMRLRAVLSDARDALRNDFEPDNQSRAWHRANDALNRTE